MTDLRALIAERRAIALSATPGPWSRLIGSALVIQGTGGEDVAECEVKPNLVDITKAQANAAHIAAMRPAVALALLDVAEAVAKLDAEQRLGEPCLFCGDGAVHLDSCPIPRLAAALGGGA